MRGTYSIQGILKQTVTPPTRFPPLPSFARSVLLACAALTVMSGTTLAPALPSIRATFPEAAGWVSLVVTAPSFTIAITAPLIGG